MTLKSTIDVDVNDAAFARFAELFEKYQAALAKTPNVWKAVSKEQAAIAEHFEKQTAALMAQNQVVRENRENESRRLTQLTTTEKLWQSMSKHSSVMLENVLGISTNVMGWIRGLGTIGLAAGVGYEAFRKVSEAATDVSGQRREAKGLGVNIGTLEAFKTAFGRQVDPSILDQMLGMETDVTKRTPWVSLGLGRMSGDVGKDMVTMMDAVRASAKATPQEYLHNLAEARQLPFSDQELMRLKGTSDAEWAAQRKQFLELQQSANIPNKNAQIAQDFETKMSAASKRIAAAWNMDMIRLMPRTGDMAATAGKNIASLLEHGIFASPEEAKAQEEQRKKDAAWAAGNRAAIGNAIGRLGAGAAESVSGAASWLSGKFGDLISEAATNYGLSTNLLTAQMMAESGGNPNAVSPKGAMGLGQFMPGTAKDLGITNPLDPKQAVPGMAKYDAQLLTHYGGNQQEMLAAYNYGMGNVDRLISKWGDAWLAHAPQETQNYVGRIMVQIQNNTGGSATASVSGLAAPSG